MASVDLLAEPGEFRDAREGRVRGPLAQHGRAVTTSPPCGSFSTRGTPVTTFAGRLSIRLNAPADMAGKGVPSVFPFVFLTETNLTGERPFHTRTRKSPGNGRRGFPATQTGEDSKECLSHIFDSAVVDILLKQTNALDDGAPHALCAGEIG